MIFSRKELKRAVGKATPLSRQETNPSGFWMLSSKLLWCIGFFYEFELRCPLPWGARVSVVHTAVARSHLGVAHLVQDMFKNFVDLRLLNPTGIECKQRFYCLDWLWFGKHSFLPITWGFRARRSNRNAFKLTLTQRLFGSKVFFLVDEEVSTTIGNHFESCLIFSYFLK